MSLFFYQAKNSLNILDLLSTIKEISFLLILNRNCGYAPPGRRRADRARTEMKLAAVAASRMSFEELREDLTNFGMDVNDCFDREEMEKMIVDLMVSLNQMSC